MPGTEEYRNLDRFEELEVEEATVVLRYDAQLYFANTSHFVDTVKSAVEAKPKTELLVLDCSSISSVDATALQALQELVADLKAQGVTVYFASVIGPVRDFLKRTGFMGEVGESHFFLGIQTAIDCYKEQGKPNQHVNYAVQTGVRSEG